MPTQNHQIESTGEKLTIQQRENAAFKSIINQLARIGQGLLILGKREAAEHCEAAIEAIAKART